MKRARALFSILLLGVGAASCADLMPSESEPEVVTDIEVTPGVVHFDALGATTAFEALALSETGVEIEDAEIEWSSTDPDVATVSSSGVVTVVGNGTTFIQATSGDVTGSATVMVEQAVYDVFFDADSVVLNYVGARRMLHATARDSRGNAVSGVTLSFGSLTPGVVWAYDTGEIEATGLGTGQVIVVPNDGGVPLSGVAVDTIRVRVRAVPATVTVSPAQDSILAGDVIGLSAVLRDSANNVIAFTPGTLTWSSSSSATASVVGSATSYSATVTGNAAGVATITANAGSASGSALITVRLDPVVFVDIAPDSAVVDIDSTAVFGVTLRDALGTTLDPSVRTIDWSTLDPTMISLSASGDSVTVTGVGGGTARLVATSEGVADTVTVRVRPPCSATGSLNVGQAFGGSLATTDCERGGVYYDLWTLNVGLQTHVRLSFAASTFQPTLHLLDANGDTVATAVGAGVGTTASFDRLLASGTYTLVATTPAPGATGSYSISAVIVPVASVTVAPDSALVGPGSIATFSATLRDSGGNLLDPDQRTITWTSSAPAVASIDVVGGDSVFVGGISEGVAEIIATSEGRADTSIVRVTTTCGGTSIALGSAADSTLAVNDCANFGRYYDRWTLVLATDTVVRIDLSSASVDAVLKLYNGDDGTLITVDDSSGTGTDAAIERALAAGNYVIQATSAGEGEVGSYHLSVEGVLPPMTIAAARAQPLSAPVIVEGVITAGSDVAHSGLYSGRSFFVQDSTGGILVVLPATATWTEGTLVRVTGTRGVYDQELNVEASDVESLGSDTVPAARIVTSADVNAELYQGELVTLLDAVVDSVVGTTNYFVYFTDASGVSQAFFGYNTGVPDTMWQAGETYDLTGIMSRFNEILTIKPRGPADVVLEAEAPDPCEAWRETPVTTGSVTNGTLVAGDCYPGDGFYYEGYLLEVPADASITLTLTSAEFDAFLIVTDTVDYDPSVDTNWLAADDDSAGGTDAAFSATFPAGSYVIWTTSAFGNETGAYQLTVN